MNIGISFATKLRIQMLHRDPEFRTDRDSDLGSGMVYLSITFAYPIDFFAAFFPTKKVKGNSKYMAKL